MKKQFKISIPKPCHEDWSTMTHKEKGRFCSSCSKIVIDFTQKTKEEIQNYLSQNFEKRICGHFNRKQLDTVTLEIPTSTFQQQLSFQKLFILALLFVMGTTLFSCTINDGKTQKVDKVILIDSIETSQPLLKEIKGLSCDIYQKDTLEIITTVGEMVIDGKIELETLGGLDIIEEKVFNIDNIIEIEEEDK